MIILSGEGTVATAFDPSQEASTALWLRAGDETYTDDGTTLVSSDGQAIQMVRNKLNTAERWRQTTAGSKPTHKVNIKNGHPVWRFDGNDFLDHNNSDHFFGGTANTLMVVVSASSTIDYIISGSGTEGGPAIITGFTPSGGSPQEFEYFMRQTSERKSFAETSTGFHILTVTRPEGPGTHKLYRDGALVNSGTNFNSGEDNWTSKILARIGRFATGSSGGITADLGEIIQCNSVLSDSRLNDFHTYAGDYWDIPVTLL